MQLFSQITAIFAFLVSMLAPKLALGKSAYPTLWTIENYGNQDIRFSCQSIKLSGITKPLAFSLVVPSKNKRTHPWEGIYNDGLGLNQGTWLCRAESVMQQALSQEITVQSGWGEAMILGVTESDGGKSFKITPSHGTLAHSED